MTLSTYSTHNAGKTAWTSVNELIEHTATIPLNGYGGALVDETGRLVGINVTSSPDGERTYALGYDIVNELFPKLQAGKGDGMGITAVALGDWKGVWEHGGILAASVRKGSLAANAGIKNGDILLLMGADVPVKTEGGGILTFEQLSELVKEKGAGKEDNLTRYCDMLHRQIQPGQPVEVIALRPETAQGRFKKIGLKTCRGQINGGELVCEPVAYLHFPWDSKDEAIDWSLMVKTGQWVEFTADYEVKDGILWLDVPTSETYAYMMYESHDYQDVRIDALADNHHEYASDISLICRYSYEIDYDKMDIKEQWYQFDIGTDGSITIYLVKHRRFNLLYSGHTALVKSNSEVMTYSAVCQGDQLTLFIEGKKVASIKNKELTTGRIGVGVLSFHTKKVKAGFWDIIIRNP